MNWEEKHNFMNADFFKQAICMEMTEIIGVPFLFFLEARVTSNCNLSINLLP